MSCEPQHCVIPPSALVTKLRLCMLTVMQVASQLGVERIGPQHQAGSDSLLTSNTFMKLVEQHFKGLEEALSHIGVLYQLGEDGDRPVYERP